MKFSFDSFIDGSFDYDCETKAHGCIWLREERMDISGGKITVADIDKLKFHPDADAVTISGLRQDTFEYFIETYGKQLKAIRFFKNKFIEDLSPLGTLPQLEYIYLSLNQRAASLWEMTNNISLTGLCIEDFSRLSSIEEVKTAPSLRDFRIGNAVCKKAVINSLMPLAGMNLEKLSFNGSAIEDNDLSFLPKLPRLKTFDFPTNAFTTEQVAWIAANFPQLEGFAIGAKRDCSLFESNKNLVLVPGTIIVGKRKQTMIIKGNEAKIERYISAFNKLKQRYKGVSYYDAFFRQ